MRARSLRAARAAGGVGGRGPRPRPGPRARRARRRRPRGPQPQVLVHAPRQVAHGAVTEQADHAVAHPLEHVAVVGHHDQRADPAVEEVLQRREGLDVEVVGRLVEEQDVGPGHQQPDELQPAPLPAGQVADARDEPFAGQPEPFRHLPRGELATAVELDDGPYVLDRGQRGELVGSSATVCDR